MEDWRVGGGAESFIFNKHIYTIPFTTHLCIVCLCVCVCLFDSQHNWCDLLRCFSSLPASSSFFCSQICVRINAQIETLHTMENSSAPPCPCVIAAPLVLLLLLLWLFCMLYASICTARLSSEANAICLRAWRFVRYFRAKHHSVSVGRVHLPKALCGGIALFVCILCMSTRCNAEDFNWACNTNIHTHTHTQTNPESPRKHQAS